MCNQECSTYKIKYSKQKKTSKPYTKKDNVAHTETHKPARQAESQAAEGKLFF